MSLDLLNATLKRIDTPQAASSSGDVAYTAGAAITVEAFVDASTGSLKWSLGDVVKDATAVMYVALADLPASPAIAAGCRVVVELDSDHVARTYQVLYRREQLLDDDEIDHVELYLKAL